MKINVLHVICYSDFYGTQRSLLSTVKNLDNSHFHCTVAAPYGEHFFYALSEADVEVVEVPMRGLWDFTSALRLASIIREKNIHILHCHLGISTFLGLIGARIAGCRRAVATRHFIHDRYVGVHPRLFPIYLGVYKWMNRQLDFTICVSEAVRRNVIKRESLADEKCVVIPNGIELPLNVSLSADERRAVRAELGAAEGMKMAVTLSRLGAEKGIDVLIDAALACGRDDLVFIVAGSGTQEKALKQKAQSLGLEAKIRFIGYRKDALRILGAADVFVLPAYEEPFGISVLEAMALGIPVVATDAGGPSEILTDGENGFLVPPGDARAMAERIILLIDNPSAAQTLTENARHRVSEFDEKVIVKRTEKTYLELMEKKR
ncbi:MAG: glycosyltransferase [bacterium]